MDANIIIYSALFIAGIAALCMLSLYAHELISTRRRAYKLIEEALQDRVGETHEDLREMNREDLKDRIAYDISPDRTSTEWKLYTVICDQEEPMSTPEVARTAGYSRPHTTRCLKRLRDRGMIDICRQEDGSRFRPYRYYPKDI